MNDTDALKRHAEWIYDNVYVDVDIDADEDGEYINVGCCLDELFDDLTKILAPIIIKADHDHLNLCVIVDGEWTLPPERLDEAKKLTLTSRTDCIQKILEWLKR